MIGKNADGILTPFVDQSEISAASHRTLINLVSLLLAFYNMVLDLLSITENKGKIIDSKSNGLYFLSLLFFCLAQDIYVKLLVEMMLLAMMVGAPQAVPS